MSVDIACYSILVLSILMLAGGIVGFKKAKSKPSLIAGIVSSILLAGCYALTMTNVKNGLYGGAFVSALLIGVFLKRLVRTKKFMPSGMLLILNAVVLGIIAIALRQVP
jgi:uncharacterized membrane protein (UPF0136 family)